MKKIIRLFLLVMLLLPFSTSNESVFAYTDDETAKNLITEEVSNSGLMSKTGITVGSYSILGTPDFYTVRFRDTDEITNWLVSLHASKLILEASMAGESQKTFWETLAPHHPVEHLLKYGALSLYEGDNGYDLTNASIMLPLADQLKNIDQDIIEALGEEFIRQKMPSQELLYKIITGSYMEIGEEIGNSLNIDFNSSNEIRNILGFILVKSTCPDYEWKNGIFYCEGNEFARMHFTEVDGKQNDMGFIPITNFGALDIRFNSDHKFPEIGNGAAPEFSADNLRYFILDAYNILTNRQPETKIKAYVQEAMEAYKFNKFFHEYVDTHLTEYKDKIKINSELGNNDQLYNSQTVTLYYKDTILLKEEVFLARITKISEEDWEKHELDSSIGPDIVVKRGKWVYKWTVPGEYPYQLYNHQSTEAQEWLEIYNEVEKIIEESDDYGKEKVLEWEPRDNIAFNHNWTIKFNNQLDEATINNDNIFILHNQEKVNGFKVSLNEDKKSVNIEPPKEGYIPGETYSLYISTSVHSDTNKDLKQPVKMEFKIAESDQKSLNYVLKRLHEGSIEINSLIFNLGDPYLKIKNSIDHTPYDYYYPNNQTRGISGAFHEGYEYAFEFNQEALTNVTAYVPNIVIQNEKELELILNKYKPVDKQAYFNHLIETRVYQKVTYYFYEIGEYKLRISYINDSNRIYSISIQ